MSKGAKWLLIDRLREAGYPAMEDLPVPTAKEVRALRDELGLSQAELALVINASELAVYRWETGRSKVSMVYRAILQMVQATYRRMGLEASCGPGEQSKVGNGCASGKGTLALLPIIYTLLL